LAGCKKEVQGPAGPQGEQGNANVSSITWNTSGAYWYGSSSTGWETSKYWYDLNQSIVDGGMVQVYAVTGGTHVALPFTTPVGNGFASVLFAYSLNSIEIGQQPSNGTSINNPGVKTYKAVIVAPRALAMGDEYVKQLIEDELRK
jgi:hypothetical protein